MHRNPRKFDPAKAEFLESEERKAILDASMALELFDIEAGWIVLDIGCGPGFFSFPLAEMVGPGGRVYGIDTEPLMLRRLEDKIVEKRVTNILTIKSNENFIPLPTNIADFAFMSTVLHELEGPDTLLEVRRLLKKNGLLGIIDWKKMEEVIGPPLEHRLSEEDASILLSAASFEPDAPFNIGPSHYGIMARKV